MPKDTVTCAQEDELLELRRALESRSAELADSRASQAATAVRAHAASLHYVNLTKVSCVLCTAPALRTTLNWHRSVQQPAAKLPW